MSNTSNSKQPLKSFKTQVRATRSTPVYRKFCEHDKTSLSLQVVENRPTTRWYQKMKKFQSIPKMPSAWKILLVKHHFGSKYPFRLEYPVGAPWKTRRSIGSRCATGNTRQVRNACVWWRRRTEKQPSYDFSHDCNSYRQLAQRLSFKTNFQHLRCDKEKKRNRSEFVLWMSDKLAAMYTFWRNGIPNIAKYVCYNDMILRSDIKWIETTTAFYFWLVY